ncbi:MAG: hypothetical protein JWO79_2301 [Actinomycetia bacterium]|nr:hypothetical protein [Actinomycetes bacterium]
MAIKHLGTARITGDSIATALRPAELGDRSAFALAVRQVPGTDLDRLHAELNARTRAGRIDPLDAAVALFDIVQAKKQAVTV